MSLVDMILGRPLATSEKSKETLSVWTGVPAAGLDALASTGYGPEAALTILTPLGLAGLKYFPFIALIILVELFCLYLSYRQTAAAYPGGGGTYIVASDNLGHKPGVLAAVMLLLDYLLNVSVGISAGIAAIVSAFPVLHPFTLPLCLVVLMTLTFLNLRGVKESGMAFIFPVLIFIGCMTAAIIIGLFSVVQSGGHPQPISGPPKIPRGGETIGLWIILAAFANGCTALTGIEAVSNAVPLFRKPTVANAQRTLTIIMLVLAVFLLGISHLSPAYHIGAMDQNKPGYQTVLSQLVAAITGRGVFYYISLGSIFVVLTYSAQTSFTGFPRVCRFLAEDGFLPPYFANRGRRLVFSHGIIFLAVISGFLLMAFRGVTQALIPLFAVGAFGAFLFSQIGMVMHWLHKKGKRYRMKLAVNALGASTTAIALIIIIVAKFVEGAWMTVIFIPVLTFLLLAIRRHYDRIARWVEQPLKLQAEKFIPPAVIIPIQGWDRVAERALRFGLLLSDDVTAIHVVTERDNPEELKQLWAEKVEKPAKAAKFAIPRLEIINSPYRRIQEPILNFVKKTRKEKPDRISAVIIPELVEPHWFEYVLHNLHAARLRAAIFMMRDRRTVVISTPWYLR